MFGIGPFEIGVVIGVSLLLILGRQLPALIQILYSRQPRRPLVARVDWRAAVVVVGALIIFLGTVRLLEKVAGL